MPFKCLTIFEATQSITSMDLGKFKEKYKEQKIDRKKRKKKGTQ